MSFEANSVPPIIDNDKIRMWWIDFENSALFNDVVTLATGQRSKGIHKSALGYKSFDYKMGKVIDIASRRNCIQSLDREISIGKIGADWIEIK